MGRQEENSGSIYTTENFLEITHSKKVWVYFILQK